MKKITVVVLILSVVLAAAPQVFADGSCASGKSEGKTCKMNFSPKNVHHAPSASDTVLNAK